MSQFDMSAEGLGLRAEDLQQKTLISVLAEFLATLLFVFIGCGSVSVITAVVGQPPSPTGTPDAPSVIAIAMAHGLAIGVLVAATAKLSGGHINPAVTFTAVVTGRMKFGPGIVYVAAQLLGAVVACLLLQLVLVDSAEGSLGLHSINDAAVEGTWAAVIIEMILTFILVFTVFATAIDPRGPGNLAPIAIGLAVLFDHIVGIPLTGASMNPARSFGPALVTGEWDDQWVYWVGPLLGGAIAGLLYYFVYLNRPDEDEEQPA